MKLTVQGWQNVILSVMGVIVLSGAIGGAILVLVDVVLLLSDPPRETTPP